VFEIARFWRFAHRNLAISFSGFRRIASHDSVVASEVAMRPKKHRTTGSGDLFRARLDQIINMKHELVQPADKVDWDWIDGEIRRGSVHQRADFRLFPTSFRHRLGYSVRARRLRIRLCRGCLAQLDQVQRLPWQQFIFTLFDPLASDQTDDGNDLHRVVAKRRVPRSACVAVPVRVLPRFASLLSIC